MGLYQYKEQHIRFKRIIFCIKNIDLCLDKITFLEFGCKNLFNLKFTPTYK